MKIPTISNKMLNDLKNRIKADNWIFFVAGDVVLVFFATTLAFLLRFDWQIPANVYNGYLAFSAIAVVATPIVFYLLGLYRIFWSYVSLTDLPAILKNVLFSPFLDLLTLIIRNEFFLFVHMAV